MKTLPLPLDEELDAALESVSIRQGRDKIDVVTEVLRKYVEAERMKQALQDPALVELYKQLAGEDIALAEEDMAEYEKHLKEIDRHADLKPHLAMLT